MDEKLQLNLVKKYPKLFEEYGGCKTKTPMHYGCAIGDGWYNILIELCEELSKYEDVSFSQIKEKFGTLRVYLNSYPKGTRNIIHKAVMRTITTCEFCGKLGKIRDGLWRKTLCESCHIKRGE